MIRSLPILLAVVLLTAPALAGEDERAGRLAQLRADVAELSEQIDLARDDQRARLRALDAQKTDAQLQARRSELRLSELHRFTEERRAALLSEDNTGDALTPVIEAALDDLRVSVRGGLPFRTAERLAALDDLAAKLDQGVLRPQQGAHRTWQAYEDELRLTRENALDRQVISLNDHEVLVEVARVGMLAIYFRTESGVVGHAVQIDGAWSWQTYADSTQIQQVERFFDALEKQIRAGWFELPDLIPEEGA